MTTGRAALEAPGDLEDIEEVEEGVGTVEVGRVLFGERTGQLFLPFLVAFGLAARRLV